MHVERMPPNRPADSVLFNLVSHRRKCRLLGAALINLLLFPGPGRRFSEPFKVEIFPDEYFIVEFHRQRRRGRFPRNWQRPTGWVPSSNYPRRSRLVYVAGDFTNFPFKPGRNAPITGGAPPASDAANRARPHASSSAAYQFQV